MSGQGAISDSDSESEKPLLTNESELTVYYTASSAEVGEPFEPLNNEPSIVDRDLLHNDSVRSESIPEGSSLHETEPQGRSSPITRENDNSSRADVLTAAMNNLRAEYISGIAKQILKIIMDRQVDYTRMFSNDVALNRAAPLSSEEGKLLYYLFIGHFKSNCSENRVENFCDKLNNLMHAATYQQEKFEYVKKRLIFFWKRILCVIETKFEPGEAELSERLLTEMTKILDETFDREKLSDIVTRIIKNVESLQYSFEWTRIFQKKISLAEMTDEHDGKSAFGKFIHRLQMSQGEETVEQFCDELHREISKELVPEVTRQHVLVFWNRIFSLIKQKFNPGEAEFSEKLLNEIRKTMVDTFKEGSLLASVVKNVLQILETSKHLDKFSEIFCPDRDVICHLADEEWKVRLAYDECILILKLNNSRERVNTFSYLLYESVNENVSSGDMWKLCVIFWNRVLCVVDQVSGQECNDVESKFMDTLEEILNDTFNGEDMSILCGQILENMKGCRNQYTLRQLFQADVVNHKPPFIENNRLDYYKLIQRLKFTNPKDNVQSFCNRLYDNISEERISAILPTLVLTFWIRVECLIKDKFSTIRLDFDRSLFPEIIKIMNDTFKGDNCLTKYSALHACCDCFCIQCAAWFHECYYKKVHRNSQWFRSHRPKFLDNCCYFICFISFSAFLIFAALVSIIGSSVLAIIKYLEKD